MRTHPKLFLPLVALAVPTMFLVSGPVVDALPLGRITGTVIDETNGRPIADLLVGAWGDPVDGVEHVGFDHTDSNGRFEITEVYPEKLDGVRPGSYILATGNGVELEESIYAREWWRDRASAQTADRVVVESGDTVVVDFELAPGGILQGTVTDEITSSPLRDVQIRYLVNGPQGWEGPLSADATDDEGHWMISGLNTHPVMVCFVRGDYHSECWDNHLLGDGPPDTWPGDWIVARPGETRSGIDAILARNVPHSGLFWDDDGSLFEADIDWLGSEGITRGCNPPANDRFCPNQPVTRAQMAAFLVRAMGYTEGTGGDRFTDDNGSIYQTDIDRLAAAGVTHGCNPPTNDRFCPNQPVTRAQMAAFLHRAVR